MIISEQIKVNLPEIGVEVNVPEREFEAPNGAKIKTQSWGKEHARKAIDIVKERAAGADEFTAEGPIPWLIFAAIVAVGAKKSFYGAPTGSVELVKLRRGEPNPASDAVFEIREEGERLYIDFTCDKPGAKGHTFMIEDLSNVVVPVLPKGKDIMLHAGGGYPIQAAIAYQLLDDEPRSIYWAIHDEPNYTCAYSAAGETEIGETVPRAVKANPQ